MYEKPNNNQTVVGEHWRNVDLSRMVAQHLYEMQQDLSREGADIPARKLFIIEACGFDVNLETGRIQERV